MPQHPDIGHVISHTHWDREWRTPVWHARRRLIRMLDDLLDQLDARPEVKHFVFDSQVVGIEDYLAFRPERSDQVHRLIAADRLQIGPWYNLPDEFPVCGEALVRNLLVGTRRAAALGGCLDIAYITFGWGQTAQLPQIFAGFGIDFVIVGKHVGPHRAPHSEFRWRAPDGTTLPATRLGVEGRANFYFSAVMPAIYGMMYKDPRCQAVWGHGGWFWHRADDHAHTEFTQVPRFEFHRDVLAEGIADAWESTRDTLVPEHRFMGNGTDSTGLTPFVSELIAEANRLDPTRQFQHSGLREFAAAVRQSIDARGIELPVVEGELRDGPVPKVSGNALATRMPLKVLNREAQAQLIRYAEPWAALARLAGVETPPAFVDEAWRQLLLAHSHDALNGVTLDKTADDTAHKLKQVIELGHVVTDHALSELLQRVDLGGYGDDDVLLAVFNPTPRPQDVVMRATIDMPIDRGGRYLALHDTAGTSLATQPIDRQRQATPVNIEGSRAMPLYADRHQVYFRTGPVPPYGYRVLRATPVDEFDPTVQFWYDVDDFGTQVTGPQAMANRLLGVVIQPNGTFDLHHQATGRWFRGLNAFEDGGDVGDYWQRVPPAHDQRLSSVGVPARIALVEDGPLVTSYRIEQTLAVPVSADADRTGRSRDTALLELATTLTLRAETPYLEVAVEVINRSRDHRLRVALPTRLTGATHAVAQGLFNVDRRPVARPYDERGRRHGEMGTQPQQHFVDVTDNIGGLAVLNRDLTEYELAEDAARTLWLTLLRCVPMRICTEFRCATTDPDQHGGQCLGGHTFHYALYPHSGDWQAADVYGVTERYLLGPCAYQVSPHRQGHLPAEHSLLALAPTALQLAAVKVAEDGHDLVVRLYNPTNETVPGRLTLGRTPTAARRLDLREQPLDTLAIDADGGVTITLKPAQVATVGLSFAEED